MVKKKPSFAELIRRSVKFPGPSVRVAGLRDALEGIEDQLKFLKDQYETRLNAKLKRESEWLHPDDIEMERYDVHTLVDELFPKVFRSGFIVSLWSVFEACIKDMAEYTRQHRTLPFGLEDLRAGDFLQQTEKFLEAVLDLKPFPDRSMRRSLDELKGFRNALVHHDGSTKGVPKSLLSTATKDSHLQKVSLHSDFHHEYAVPSAAYAHQSLDLISDCLKELADRVYQKVHPEALEDED